MKTATNKKESREWQKDWPWPVCMLPEKFEMLQHFKKHNMPGPSPASEPAEAALKAINDAHLAAYQRFHMLGLAMPSRGEGEYFISLDYHGNSIRGFKAEHRDNPELSVSARNGDQLLEYARRLRDAWEKGKRRPGASACCILAEFTPCVCTSSFKCPIHGEAHHGTHD